MPSTTLTSFITRASISFHHIGRVGPQVTHECPWVRYNLSDLACEQFRSMRRMARIVLTTFGSSGDINPYVALALGLRARGHEVTFAVEESFRGLVERLGFPVAHLAGDAIAVMNTQSLDLLRDTNPFRSVH